MDKQNHGYKTIFWSLMAATTMGLGGTASASSGIELAERLAIRTPDDGMQSASLEVGRKLDAFTAAPGQNSLFNLHLACRGLSSQLNRFKLYQGPDAILRLKEPIMDLLEQVKDSIYLNSNAVDHGSREMLLLQRYLKEAKATVEQSRSR